MSKILVTCALPSEMKAVKAEIKQLGYHGIKVDFLLTGVGNYNVIYALKDYIDKQPDSKKPDFILNIGVCGKSNHHVCDDFFQVYRVKNAANKREVIPPIYVNYGNLQSICSSDTIIVDPELMFGEDYVDMESYGIDFIATKERIPFMIIKKPFDIVSLESKKVDISLIGPMLRNLDYQLLFQKIETFLQTQNSSKKAPYQYYQNYFGLTFSEVEIFKKNYHKCEAYGINFQQFFDENKHQNKDEFLKKLSALSLTVSSIS